MRDIGVNLRVTSNCNQGGRKYMEDVIAVHFENDDDTKEIVFAYFGIFDGHGGAEASNFTKEHLIDEIACQKGFWSHDDEQIKKAIRDGFLNTHNSMWKAIPQWSKTLSGLPSTAGTTASICIVMEGKLYIGHVGDSGIVLGYQDRPGTPWKAKLLTRDHKPDCPIEKTRIEKMGGSVVCKSGVQRVVWNRPKISHKGPVRRSTPIEKIPFLAVARSLGDLWSYNNISDDYAVSPEPDVHVFSLDPAKHRCLILGTDGLWNMITPKVAVEVVEECEKETVEKVLNDPKAGSDFWVNPSLSLVEIALERWKHRLMRADNTSCVTVMLDPWGPSKSQLLRQQRVANMKKHRPGSTQEDLLFPKTPQNTKLNSAPPKSAPAKLHSMRRSKVPKLSVPNIGRQADEDDDDSDTSEEEVDDKTPDISDLLGGEMVSELKVAKPSGHRSSSEALKKELKQEAKKLSEESEARIPGPLTKLKVTKKGTEPSRSLSKHVGSNGNEESEEAATGSSSEGTGARRVAGNLTNSSATSSGSPASLHKKCSGSKSTNQSWCTHKQNGPALFERTPDIEASVVTVNGQGSEDYGCDQNLEQCRPRTKKPILLRPPQRLSDSKRLGPSIEQRIACLKRKRDMDCSSGNVKRSKAELSANHKLKLERQSGQQQITSLSVTAQS